MKTCLTYHTSKGVVAGVGVDNKHRTIPFDEVNRLVNTYPYGSKYRVILRWLAETGARPSEMSHRSLDEIHRGTWNWQPGKGQNGIRKEQLSESFWREFHTFLNNNSYRKHDVFGICANTFNRYLHKHRQLLGGEWMKQVPCWGQRGISKLRYKYQVKALRHNFATLLFYQMWKKFGSAEVAALMVAKRMAHSSFKITVIHYVEDLEELGLNETHLSRKMQDIYNVEEDSPEEVYEKPHYMVD